MRLIDANELLEKSCEVEAGNYYGQMVDVRDIEEAPTIDPYKHGHWINTGEEDGNGNYSFHCSACGYSDIHSKSIEVPYCWHCGAKMDEKIKEN